MYDIHTHLYWHTFDADRDAVIERARKAGVKAFMVVGCTVEESRQAVALAEQYDDVYASIGIHPQEFTKHESWSMNHEAWKNELRQLAGHPKVVAIGECGLEYYAHPQTTDEGQPTTMTEEQKTMQKAGFLAQIELAQELDLPLIVHCRASTGSDDAYRDLLHILQTTTYKLPTILHCYMGNTEVTQEFLKLPKVYFSFTGNITYPVKSDIRQTMYDLRETVKLVPLERILTETDCPFLAPQAERGKRNEPAFVVEVAKAIALQHSRSLDEVEATIDQNVAKIFPQLG